MGTLLSLRIQEHFEQLSPSEQKVAAVLLERSDDILTFSATELANLSKVSKATAARVFRSLGYGDFNEVRLQARQERNRTGPLQAIVVPTERPHGSTTIAGHLQIEMAILTRTFEALRPDVISDVAEHLAAARRVWIAGLGHDAAAARLARSLLARVRPSVQMLGEDTTTWPEDLASMGPDHVLLLVAPRPWVKPVSALLDFARTARAQAIVLTDPTSDAAVRRHGALPLLCYTLKDRELMSYTAFSSMVSLIHLACLDKLGKRALVRMDLVDELKEQLDLGT
jgi:DNA-binding MurR/RpiR family transcriptional regulator